MTHNKNELLAFALHEAGHAVVAYSLGWSVKNCQVSGGVVSTFAEPNADFKDCEQVWSLVEAENRNIEERAAKLRTAPIEPAPLVKAMLYLMAGDIFERGPTDSCLWSLFSQARCEADPQGDANKLRILEAAWMERNRPACSGRLIHAAFQHLYPIGFPVVSSIAQPLATSGSITQDDLEIVGRKNESACGLMATVLASLVRTHATML